MNSLHFRVVGKFSIRLVPQQTLEEVGEKVEKHLQDVFNKRNSPNKMNVTLHHGTLPWLADYNNPNYDAGKRAVKRGNVYCCFF